MDSENPVNLFDRQALVDLVTSSFPINSPLLIRKAEKVACNNTAVAMAGNAISIYAMLVLQEVLAQQALNPVANLDNIVNITTAISNLAEYLTINIL